MVEKTWLQRAGENGKTEVNKLARRFLTLAGQANENNRWTRFYAIIFAVVLPGFAPSIQTERENNTGIFEKKKNTYVVSPPFLVFTAIGGDHSYTNPVSVQFVLHRSQSTAVTRIRLISILPNGRDPNIIQPLLSGSILAASATRLPLLLFRRICLALSNLQSPRLRHDLTASHYSDIRAFRRPCSARSHVLGSNRNVWSPCTV